MNNRGMSCCSDLLFPSLTDSELGIVVKKGLSILSRISDGISEPLLETVNFIPEPV